MSDLRTSVILDMSGNLSSRAKRFGEALGDMSRRGQRSMSILRNSVTAAGRGLDALGNRYTALLTGAAGVGTARMIMGLETRFTYLGIQANASADKMDALKRSIYEVAQSPDIRVDPGEMISAIEQIVEKTGDLEFAEKNLRNIGLAISATNAEGGAIGELFGEFQKMDIKAPDEVLRAMDTLNKQGKLGAFTLQNLAALGPRVITAYTATGREGTKALLEMGAALQMIRMGTGSSEMAATAFEATLRTLSDPTKLKLLQRAGIKVYEDGVMRPINELMAEIVQKTGGDKVKLGKIFDAEAVRAFNQAAGEFKRTGSLESLQQFMEVQGDGSTTLDDSARAANNASAAMQSLYTAWQKFADSKLTAPIQTAANALNALGSEGTDTLLSMLGYGAAGIGALVLGRKAYKGGKGLMNMFSGKGGLAGAAAGLGGMKLPLPVYVVNSKMSLMPGELGGGADFGGGGKLGKNLSKRGGKLGKLGKALGSSGKWAGRIGGALALAGSAYQLYDAWSDDEASTSQKVQATGGAIGSGLGGWGGAMAGAATGAMLGSIVPVIGTGIGAAIGGALGGIGGSLGGDWLGDALGGVVGKWFDKEPPEASLRVEVSDDRVRVSSMENNGFKGVDIDSGPYMPGVGR